MKKIATILTVILVSTQLFAYKHRIDSIVIEKDGVKTEKIVIELNEELTTNSYKNYAFKNNSWTLASATTHLRDGNNIDTTIVTTYWDGSKSYEEHKKLKYNGLGCLTSQLTIKLVGTDTTKLWLSEYSYDIAGQLTSEKNYKYTNGVQKFYTRFDYKYTNGNLTEKIFYYENTNSWQLGNKYTYEYKNGKINKENYYYYDGPNAIQSTYINYIYNTDGQLIRKEEFNTEDTELNRYEYSYNSDNDLVESKTYNSYEGTYTKQITNSFATDKVGEYAGLEFALDIMGQNNYTYALKTVRENARGNITNTTYHYSTFASTNIELTSISDLVIFANNGRIVANVPMRIYTLTGIDVTTQNGSLSGIYIVKTEEKTVKIVVR